MELLSTPAVNVQGELPFSKPGLTMSCVAEAELMVKEMVVV